MSKITAWIREPKIRRKTPLSVRHGPLDSLLPGAAVSGSTSLFDELKGLDYWALDGQPLDAGYHSRRLVLAKTAIAVDSLVADTFNLTLKASLGLKTIANFNFDKIEEKSWTEQWRGDIFTDLWELGEDLELLGDRMELNTKTITSLLEVSDKSPITLEKTQEWDDISEWRDLERRRQYALQTMARTTESYVQSVAATGASFANLQAKTSRKLTGLATLFVPASLCAAVLAIPSFSGAGDVEKFWIFWAVSVPIAIILAIWFLSPLERTIKKVRERRKEKREDEARKEKIVAERREQERENKAMASSLAPSLTWPTLWEPPKARRLWWAKRSYKYDVGQV
ncbi:hypothetical protein F5883DRAFT_573362 [Diaporthe sp. PMI_573]|nr:hypothetical protein F5883DRAFT_573362 [Diaporthaceae sp. PMI_573]